MSVKSFRRWLEDLQHEPEQMRKTIISYLKGHGLAVEEKDLVTMPLNELDMDDILGQLNGLDLFVSNPNKDQAMQVLSRGNATFGDFLDALASGPKRLSGPGDV